MLKKYRSDPSHVLEPEEVELNPDLSYEEEPVMILDSEVKKLRNKNVTLAKSSGETTMWKKPRGNPRRQ
ncbi:hypothetical protein GQ457_17G007170 [Hibiscus cannabinus]